MYQVFRSLLLTFLFLSLVYLTIWGTLALWYKLPGSGLSGSFFAACFGLLGVGTLLSFFRPVRWRWISVFSVVLIAINIWWNTLTPPMDGNWSPELARQVTGEIEGDILTLDNVRDFEWRTSSDFVENWTKRAYDLSQLETVDLFMSYWAGPNMGHFMLSFGFANGDYLTWSNEVRREVGGSFSPVADYFKAHSISVVAAEERDVVGLRSNIQKSRVQIFQLRTDAQSRRRLIEAYVAAANEVSLKPRWFNSVFTNCSRSVITLARGVGIDLPLDYRVLVNGYFPNYLYDRGTMNSDVSLEEIYRLGDITERAAAVGLTDAFSEAIRQGLPLR